MPSTGNRPAMSAGPMVSLLHPGARTRSGKVASAKVVGRAPLTANLVTSEAWSPTLYKSERRLIVDFEQANVLAFDVDEDMALEEACFRFLNYRHIIGTSVNHQLVKNPGLPNEKPACDRYRIILFLSAPITSATDYRHTLEEVASQLGIPVDGQAVDAARWFIPCREVVSESADGLLVDPMRAPEPAARRQPAAASQSGNPEKGRLSKATVSFLVGAQSKVGWHKRFIKAAMDFKEQGYSEEEAEIKLRAASPVGELDDNDLTQLADVFANRGGALDMRVDPNQAFRDLVEASVYVLDVKTNEGLLFNEKTGSTVEVNEQSLLKLMGRQALAAYRATNFLFSHVKYDPFTPKALHRGEHGMNRFNCYQPPLWQRDYFYFGGSLPTATSLPEIYESFLNHLVNGDQESVSYVLDWLATALKSRNLTILTAIGEEGVGKGVLGEVMAKLVGEHNFVRTRDEIFKNKFNAQLRNKRLVYLDEVALADSTEYNRLKDLVNDKIEIERKGIDAEYADNFASFYLSSNLLDAIKPGTSDRRFSIISLTDTKLTATPLIGRISELHDQANIASLAGYLLARKPARDMLVPFRSDRYRMIVEASLAEWEYYLVYEWTAHMVGKEISVLDLQEHLKEVLDLRHAPGRTKLQEIAKRFPSFLHFSKRANGSIRMIQVLASPTPPEDVTPRRRAVGSRPATPMSIVPKGEGKL